jgi:hypothetical protein
MQRGTAWNATARTTVGFRARPSPTPPYCITSFGYELTALLPHAQSPRRARGSQRQRALSLACAVSSAAGKRELGAGVGRAGKTHTSRSTSTFPSSTWLATPTTRSRKRSGLALSSCPTTTACRTITRAAVSGA